jgi:hypothetical protein
MMMRIQHHIRSNDIGNTQNNKKHFKNEVLIFSYRLDTSRGIPARRFPAADVAKVRVLGHQTLVQLKERWVQRMEKFKNQMTEKSGKPTKSILQINLCLTQSG